MHVSESTSISDTSTALEWFRTLADTAPVMIWFSGPDGRSTYFNQRWLDFTGRPLDCELGQGWEEVIHPDDQARCLETYREAFEARREFEIECRARRFDGVYRWHLNRGTPVHAPDGTFLGFIGSCIDVTERRHVDTRRLEVLEHAQQTLFAIGLAAKGAIPPAPQPRAQPVIPSLDALAHVADLAKTGAEQLREALGTLELRHRAQRCARRELQQVAREFSHRTGTRADLVLSGPDKHLESASIDGLLAAVQNSLSVIAERQRGHTLLLGVHVEPRHITLCIQDDAGLAVRTHVPRSVSD